MKLKHLSQLWRELRPGFPLLRKASRRKNHDADDLWRNTASNPTPPEQKNNILYIRMTIGETELMGSDAPPERFQPMRSAYLSLRVDSNEEAERIHALLADGGDIFMPMAETFFAFRFSMLRDKFGTSWIIIHQRPMPDA